MYVVVRETDGDVLEFGWCEILYEQSDTPPGLEPSGCGDIPSLNVAVLQPALAAPPHCERRSAGPTHTGMHASTL